MRETSIDVQAQLKALRLNGISIGDRSKVRLLLGVEGLFAIRYPDYRTPSPDYRRCGCFSE